MHPDSAPDDAPHHASQPEPEPEPARTPTPARPPDPNVPGEGWQSEPADPDTAVDPWPATRQQPGPRRRQAEILAAIAAGGVIGACARYGATLLWPTAPAAFPWTTFWINVSGCALMGVLMVLVTERPGAHPLARPFLGTGILGGYTTFSTYTVDAHRLLDADRTATALLYLTGTLGAALFAVWATAALTRRLVLPPHEGDRP